MNDNNFNRESENDFCMVDETYYPSRLLVDANNK